MDATNKCQNRKGKGPQIAAPAIAIPFVQAGTSLPLDASEDLQPQGVTYLPVPLNDLMIYSGSRSSGSSVIGESRANSPYPDGLLLRQSGSRSLSVLAHSVNRGSPAEWSVGRQNTFNTQLGRLTASVGLPISWIENPEFILFCQEFIHPLASVPSRKVLTCRILPTIKREFQKRDQAAIKAGSMATIQGDGWSAINDHHLNAFMMTVERKVCNTTSAYKQTDQER